MWTPPPYLRSLPLIQAWRYRDQEGETLGWVARYEKDNEDGKKQIIPFFTKWGDGFKAGAESKPRSLYGLHLLNMRPKNGVLIVEGEKCARALHQLRFLALSPSMGANSVGNVDFSPLDGRRIVCIIPDNDPAGETFTQEVAKMVRELPNSPRVCRLNLPDLPYKGDIVDYIQARIDWDGYSQIHKFHKSELRSLILAAMKAVRPILSPVRKYKEDFSMYSPISVPLIKTNGRDLKKLIKQRVDMTPLVAEITEFSYKRGDWTHFICPFHEEEEGSFGCIKDYYHCFGCGAKGDSVDFIMKAYGCNFKEALRILADKLGIKESP